MMTTCVLLFLLFVCAGQCLGQTVSLSGQFPAVQGELADDSLRTLASQVVAGMNYCLLCRLTVVYPDAQPTYALVYVYQNIEGACELARVEDITFSIQEPVAE